MVAERIADIERRITAACECAGRPRTDVRLVAVTKTQPADVVNAAIAAGLVDIGENRVQEYRGKCDALLPHRFHMIGRLQANKVRHIVDVVHLIHSVDSLELAREIDRRAAAIGRVVDILLQVHTSAEETKAGVAADEAEDVARALATLPWVRVRGLMTIGSLVDEAELVRPEFRLLRALLERLAPLFPVGQCSELSMGMTGDFEVAIEEGATMLRIGSALFGPRA